MREDLLAQVLGLPAPEVAVLAQRGMPTYCWTAARAWCLLHGYLPVQVQAPPPGSGPVWHPQCE
jgi:hypothetical protein